MAALRNLRTALVARRSDWFLAGQLALFPPRCLLCGLRCGVQCGQGAEGSLDLCAVCQGDLPAIAHPCPCCGLPRPASAELLPCGACLRRPPAFGTLTLRCAYRDPADLLVIGLKFRRQFAAARVMAALMAQAAPDDLHDADTALLAVPLHWRRRWRRGFDQAALLATELARITGARVLTATAVRTRATAPQSRLPLPRRRSNLLRAFRIRGDALPRRVILVDDVMTTGATLNALAGSLRRAGARRVDAWVFARTLRPNDLHGVGPVMQRHTEVTRREYGQG